MALRLFLSVSVASLVMVGCPGGERAAQSSHESSPAAFDAPLLVQAANLPATLRSGSLGASVARLRSTAEPLQPVERSRQPVRTVHVTPEPSRALASTSATPLHEDLLPGRTLGALSKETVVYAAPRRSSRKLGFLRQGALVRRSVEPAGHEGCPKGWYRVAPEGFVCIGKTATLDLKHPLLQLTETRADRSQPMPYRYGRARFPTPALYTRIPTRAQQLLLEPNLDAQLARPGLRKPWDDVVVSALPEFLSHGQRVPRPFGYPVLEREFVSGQALPETGFAFLEFFEHEGRRFGLTTDLNLVPMDRVAPVKVSSFHGIVLSESAKLPVAFVRSKGAFLYEGDPKSTGLKITRALEYREAVPLAQDKVFLQGGRYLKTQSGHWILDKHLVRVDPMRSRPSWAQGSRSWLEVSLLDQTLVAYEGATPVYTTLVSTGIGGIGDPVETHATIQGTFLIHTKHVTATMNSDEVGDEFDLRDVPYVQYFQDGYAFHAAYWHDAFGRPKSHGCVNLSPADARWLFHWTAPFVPRAWHSSLSLKDGTLVYIHP